MTRRLRRAFLLATLMLSVAALAPRLAPARLLADERPALDFSVAIPADLGEWHEEISSVADVVNPQGGELVGRLYDQVVSRVYIGPDGYRVMLSVAYGRDQRGALQLHYPEVCYPSAGFQITSNHTGTVHIDDILLPVRRLETFAVGGRFESVTYWTLVGSHPNLGGFEKKAIESRYALNGLVPDGIVVRVSSIDFRSNVAFEQQRSFLEALYARATPELRLRLFGTHPVHRADFLS